MKIFLWGLAWMGSVKNVVSKQRRVTLYAPKIGWSLTKEGRFFRYQAEFINL